MDNILTTAKDEVKKTLGYDIRILKKYVDDIFIVLPSNIVNDVFIFPIISINI